MQLELDEKNLYQEIYSREYRKWVLINFTTGFAVAGGLSLLLILSAPSIGDGPGPIFTPPDA